MVEKMEKIVDVGFSFLSSGQLEEIKGMLDKLNSLSGGEQAFGLSYVNRHPSGNIGFLDENDVDEVLRSDTVSLEYCFNLPACTSSDMQMRVWKPHKPGYSYYIECTSKVSLDARSHDKFTDSRRPFDVEEELYDAIADLLTGAYEHHSSTLKQIKRKVEEIENTTEFLRGTVRQLRNNHEE